MYNEEITHCEICNNKFSKLQKHHIKSKCYGGNNNKYNLAHVCPNCHVRIHIGEIICEGRFDSCPSGNIVIWRKTGEESVSGLPDPKVYIIPSKHSFAEIID